ncbi:MAG: homocysteine S-methyltransferase family protein, partial [Acidobacteria bacterium]|nr:homocysteine S-methyltransferase family protein [Acidobacteriota bacterium]
GRGRLLSGEPLAAVATALLADRVPPVGLGLTGVPARRLARDLEVLSRSAPAVPLLAAGNTGRARDEARGLFEEPIEPAAYAREAVQWIRLGARIVGGCCGTSAPHVAALAGLVTGSSRESSSDEGSCP